MKSQKRFLHSARNHCGEFCSCVLFCNSNKYPILQIISPCDLPKCEIANDVNNDVNKCIMIVCAKSVTVQIITCIIQVRLQSVFSLLWNSVSFGRLNYHILHSLAILQGARASPSALAQVMAQLVGTKILHEAMLQYQPAVLCTLRSLIRWILNQT